MINVTCAVIRNEDNEVLVVQRGEATDHPFKWEFPGGKVQFAEDPKDALVRKIKSGLNVTADVDELCTIVSHVYLMGDEKTHVVLLAYFADFVEGEVTLNDYTDAKWIDYEELNNYGFIAADQPIIKELLLED